MDSISTTECLSTNGKSEKLVLFNARLDSMMTSLWAVVVLLLALLPVPVRASMQFVTALYGGPVLDGAYGIAASPDGKHLYATGYYAGVIAIFQRDTITGTLTLAGFQRDGVGGVDGLDSVMDAAVSPDGRSVYAVGDWDDGLAVFSRDMATGQLTFIEVHKDGVGSVDGLEGAVAVVVSPDNRHVYVAGSLENSVVVFSRDTTTGTLTFVAVYNDEVASVEGIYGASAIAFSPDGAQLYVAGYYGDSLAVFSRDSDTGCLTFVEAFYDGSGDVDGLAGAYSVAVSADGHHLYIAGEYDDAVALFIRDTATGRLTFVHAYFDGADGMIGLAGANDIAISPGDGHLYVSGWWDDTLVTLARNSATGALSFVQMQQDGTDGVDGLYGPRSVVVSADGAHVYTAGGYDNGLGMFARNDTTGLLRFVVMVQERFDGADGLYGVIDVTVSPDGRHVYTAAYDDDSVAVFGRDAATGQLTFIEAHKDGIDGIEGIGSVHAVAVSPDGAHLYAAGYGDDAVAMFGRDNATGRLTFLQVLIDGVDGVDGLDGARDVIVSPDGGHVYVAGYTEDSVAVFTRNSTTGALVFSQVLKDNTDGVDGLDGVRGLAVSADGRNLYAAGRSDSAVAVFSRDTVTGNLAYLEFQRDGTGGVDGLYGARAVALSADNGHLYAAGHYDDAVAVFSREAASGLLAFVEMIPDGGGVDGLNGACDLVVSPDGSYLYAAGYYDNAVVAFTRDSVTGALTFEEKQRDGSTGVDGLSAISSLAISPDGYHLYIAGYYDSAVAVFQVKTPPNPPDPPDPPDPPGNGDDPPADSGGGGGGCFINTLFPPFGI